MKMLSRTGLLVAPLALLLAASCTSGGYLTPYTPVTETTTAPAPQGYITVTQTVTANAAAPATQTVTVTVTNNGAPATTTTPSTSTSALGTLVFQDSGNGSKNTANFTTTKSNWRIDYTFQVAVANVVAVLFLDLYHAGTTSAIVDEVTATASTANSSYETASPGKLLL